MKRRKQLLVELLRFLTIALYSFFPAYAIAQSGYVQASDTIIYYNSKTATTLLIAPANYDPNLVSAHTNGNIGLLPGTMDFNLLNNYCTDTGKMPRCAIENDYSIENYPLRCMVRLNGYKGAYSAATECTGTLIGKKFVLTAAHCIYDGVNNRWNDSIRVYPALNITTTPPEIKYTASHQYYLFKNWFVTLLPEGYETDSRYDMALIKLDTTIGEVTGWLPLGFNNDLSFHRQNPLFIMGYPWAADHFHPGFYYNEQSLYFQQLYFDTIISGPPLTPDSTQSEVFIFHLPIVPGFSGSSALAIDNGSLVCYGVVNGFTDCVRITASKWFNFKSIMDADSESSNQYNYGNLYFSTFPNPSNGTFNLNCKAPANTNITATLYSALGQRTGAWQFSLLQGYSTQPIDAGPLPAGMYLLRITGAKGEELNTTKVLISPQ